MQFWSNQTLAFLTFTDLYLWSVLNLVKLSRIIILYFWILGMYLLFLKVKFFFGCICSRSCILKDLWKCRSRIIKELPFKFQFNLFANFDMSWQKNYFRIEVHFGEHRKFFWRISFNLVLVIVKQQEIRQKRKFFSKLNTYTLYIMYPGRIEIGASLK